MDPLALLAIAMILGGLMLARRPQLDRWPTDAPHVTQDFHSAHNPTHNGVDIRALTPIPLAACGTCTVTALGLDPRDASGLHVIVRGTGAQLGIRWSYSHLSRVDVKMGQTLTADDIVGLSGNTGQTEGPHLHFVTMDLAFKSFDPMEILPPLPPTVAT